MEIIVQKNCILTSNKLSVGYCKENKAETLNITVENETLHDKDLYIEFRNNEKTYTTDKLTLIDGKCQYEIPNGILQESGTLSVQIVFRKDEWVKKTNVINLVIKESICAGDALAEEHPDFISNAQAILKECQEAAQKTEDYTPAIIDVDELPEETKDLSFYRVKKVEGGEIQGTAIPDSGTTTLDDFLYPNFELSIEETVAFLEKLTLNNNKYDILLVGDESGNQAVLYITHNNNEWRIILGAGAIFSSKNGWDKEEFEKGLEQEKTLLKLIFEADEFNIKRLNNNQNELIKNVISGTPYELVGAEITYPLYHTKDGKATEIKTKGGVKKIDLAEEEQDTFALKNGTYIIYNSMWETNDKYVILEFGQVNEMGKFINFGYGLGINATEYVSAYSSGRDEEGAFVGINYDTFKYNKNLYIEVRDNDVFINLSDDM